MSKKLILILIDGIGADFFVQQRQWLPHMNHFANNGLLVNRLAPETCATSLPDRASMLTGQPSREHGIHGNIIWNGQSFRYASPYHIKSTAITRMTKAHFLNVACVGYGMARREDCTLFHPPFWVRDYMPQSSGQLSNACGWQQTLEGEPDFLVGNSCAKSVQNRLLHQSASNLGYELPGQINDQILMGTSHYASSHGFRFGHGADERFAIFSRPDIPHTTESFAAAEQVTPTLAPILKLPPNPFPASSLI